MNRSTSWSDWRRQLILLAASLFILGACTGGATEAPDTQAPVEETEPLVEETEPVVDEGPGEPILILEWSGYEVTGYPYLFPAFAEKYTPTLEAVVEYSFFAEDSEALAKMMTGFEADLIHPCESTFETYVENGLVQPVDTARLEHWDSIHPALAAIGKVDGQQYFVPWDWGYESILVRPDLVEEVPDSWADLWDPQYAGKVVLWDSGQANYAITALALGITDPWGSLNAETVEMVKQKLLELKPNLLTYWTDYTQAYDLSATGDAWLTANAWQDAYGNLVNLEIPAEYIEPVEGRLGWVCGYGISTNAKNLDLVYEFLNAATAPESSAALGNYYWYGGANTDSVPLVDEYVVDFMKLTEIDSLFARTIFYQPISEEERQMLNQMWDEVKAAP